MINRRKSRSIRIRGDRRRFDNNDLCSAPTGDYYE